ncbi:MAG: autotransporter outer membrane beta-barrel domain-containing protein [Opitutaceae bacterium]|jgi:outer membrane autotransporter protein|nr:autotransporter outer membrane beta-barrel domain-containing protein [Opitutaceae bacterium]
MKTNPLLAFGVAAMLLPSAAPAAEQIVTATTGAGDGSLHKAVADAADGDSIWFAGSAAVVTLSGSLLFSGKTLTVSGTGGGMAGPVEIRGNGSRPAIVNTATTHMDNVIITGGVNAAASGGGIRHMGGVMYISNALFISNTAQAGGGFYNGGTAVMVSSTFQQNHATTGGAGGIRNNAGASFTGADLVFLANTTANYGGAIRAHENSVMTLAYSAGFSGTQLGNMAASGGGFAFLYDTAAITLDVAGRLVVGAENASATAGLDSITSSNNRSVLTKTGAGTLVLNADNTGFLGAFNINAGVVQVSSTLNLGAGRLAGAGTLALDGAGAGFAFTTTQNTGSFAGAVRLQNGTTLDLDALDAATREFVTRATLQLAAGGTATAGAAAGAAIGDLHIDGGTLLLATGANGVPGHILTAGLLTGAAGVVRLSGWDGASGGGTIADGLNLIDQSSMVDVETVPLVAASAVGDVSRLILQDRNGAAVDTGERRENLGAADAVYGSISLAGGGADGGAGLYLSIGQKLKELAIHDGGTFELSTDGYIAGSARTLDAVITGGSGNLRITGSAPVIFAAANVYTGKTILAGSVTLAGGRQDVIAGSSALEIGKDATFQTGNFDQRIKSLAGTGGVEIAADRTLTIDIMAGGSAAFGGVISGPGILRKAGGGMQTLQNINISGVTRVDAGVLDVPGIVSGAVINSATLRAGVINGHADNRAGGVILPAGGALVFQSLSNNGVVNLAGMAFGGTAAINGELSGSGTLAMEVNLNTGAGQHLTVAAASGGHTLALADIGGGAVANPGALRIALVTVTGSNTATFSGTVYDAGGMTLFAVRQEGGEVFLAEPRLTIAGGAMLLTAGAAATEWHYNLDSLRSRLGELRDAPAPGFGGFWVRGNSYRVDAEAGLAGDGFAQDTFGLTAGFDRAPAWDGGVAAAGGFLSLGRTLRAYNQHGSGGSSDAGAGVYALLMHKNGLFADIVLRGDFYKNKIDAIETAGTRTRADYDSAAWGASAEAGWRMRAGPVFWMEPSVQAAAVRLPGAHYTASTGLAVRVAGATAAQCRAQLRVGASPGRWRIHARAGEAGSDTSGGRLRAGTEYYDPQFDGWRFEAGAGVSFQADENKQWYFDYEYDKAALYTRPWSVSLGCRFAW